MDGLLAVAGASNSNSVPQEVDSLLRMAETKKIKKIRRKNRPIKGKKVAENDESDTVAKSKKTPKKMKNEESTVSKNLVYNCHELSSTLRIQPVSGKDTACLFIRKRSTRFKYIRLQKYNNCAGRSSNSYPVIFTTKLQVQQKVNNDDSLQDLLAELNINNTVQTPKPNNSKVSDKKRRNRFLNKMKENKSPKKTSKKHGVLDKKPQPLRGYITRDEMEGGLKKGALVKGIIRINPRNSREAYVSNEDRTVLDYVILSMLDRNGAMEGDEVVLEVYPETEWKDGKATAKVVYILRKVTNFFLLYFLYVNYQKMVFETKLIDCKRN